MTSTKTKSEQPFDQSRQRIPGGVVSINRKVDPEIAFVKGFGAHMWDADGKEYLDYHAAFCEYLLAHNHPAKRVLIAGTYNGHPIPMAACIGTME